LKLFAALKLYKIYQIIFWGLILNKFILL
jgi:hypothetical protein